MIEIGKLEKLNLSDKQLNQVDFIRDMLKADSDFKILSVASFGVYYATAYGGIECPLVFGSINPNDFDKDTIDKLEPMVNECKYLMDLVNCMEWCEVIFINRNEVKDITEEVGYIEKINNSKLFEKCGLFAYGRALVVLV